MCHKCSQTISKPTDSHLCQRCTDERYQKEIGGLTELIEDAKRGEMSGGSNCGL